jgi:NTE family protein
VSTRALVLGGGGVTGIAWELGILSGLADAGLDLADADVVVGTSAGSVVGAQLTSDPDVQSWYAAQLEPADAEIGGDFGVGTMVRLALPWLVPGRPLAKRRRVGRAARRAHPEAADRRLEVIRSRIGVTEWPERDLRITVVHAETGRSRVLTRDSGVDLIHAVAASCAVPFVWPPVPLDDGLYVDGGIRSTTNTDLATGADRVVVVAPLPRSYGRYHAIRTQLHRLGDPPAAVLSPDSQSLTAIGRNMLDPSRRVEAARAGRRQAADVVEEVRAAWEDR